MTLESTTPFTPCRPAASAPGAQTSSGLRGRALAGRPPDDELIRRAVLERLAPPDISAPVGEFQLASLSGPCETLSGFFYDLAWREDCAVLLVADVRGSGVEAALATMLAKAAFVESVCETGDPGTLASAMRMRLHRLMPRRTYVSAAVARVPHEGADLGLANAGLPRPFVLRAGERRIDELALDGVPLGLFLDRHPEPRMADTVRLEPGDLLFIGSDDTNRIAVGRRGAQGAAHT